MDGKAPLSHTHTQSQVTGLDAALAGKAPLATLNTRVPENLALRLDTTVGTRIFAGSTMIYGDTGLRDVSGLISDYASGVAVFQRIGNVCYLLLKDVRLTSTTARIRISNARTAYTNFDQLSYNSAANEVSWGRFAGQWNSYPAIWPGAAGTPISLNASWPTRDGWPGALPGLPV